MNLYENAIRAVGEAGRIVVRVGGEGDTAFIDVSDDGCGIRAEDAERVFEPFYSARRSGDGLGLGLSIGRQLARRYGGDLRLIDSELRTTFRLQLPSAESIGGGMQ